MKSRRRRTARPLPLMLLELTLASWETISRRTLLMARGACSPAEYQKMVREKAAALTQTTRSLARSRTPSPTALLSPWHAKATANAKRLRRK